MANCCTFNMVVAGRKENVEEFIEVLNSYYHYDENGEYRGTFDRHLCRVNGKEVVQRIDDKQGNCEIYVSGDCAWSIYSSMTEGGYYSRRYKKDYGDRSHATTLKLESRKLQLKIEVFSEEEGFGFREHYRYDNGDVIVEEVSDFGPAG